MEPTSLFEHFFKPDIRRAGEELIAKGAVYLQRGSDTQVEASIRGSTPARVAFHAQSIASPSFNVSCNCKAAAKGQLCKHIWATLTLAAEKSPDFFDCKTSLEKTETAVGTASAKAPERAPNPEALARADAMKERQAAYRKETYQRQKQRAKELKGGKRADAPSKANMFDQQVEPEVAEALKYFEQNGFTFSSPSATEEVQNAKRLLSRIFHPDKGGTHDEIVELLRHADALLNQS